MVKVVVVMVDGTLMHQVQMIRMQKQAKPIKVAVVEDLALVAMMEELEEKE